MTVIELIKHHLVALPPERQAETLDFVLFLERRQRQQAEARTKNARRSLRDHPAFGMWRERGVDALAYEQTLRSEWDDR